MGTPRCSPREELSKQEQFVIGRLKRTGRLFAFLRSQRHVLFDDVESGSSCRTTSSPTRWDRSLARIRASGRRKC